MGKTGFGHHVVVAGYDLDAGTVTIFEPNDVLPYSIYPCPIEVFRRAWEESAQWRDGRYEPWPNHHPFGGEWSLHDGYGPYLMVWIEPERDPHWDIAKSIRDSYRRNEKSSPASIRDRMRFMAANGKFLNGRPGRQGWRVVQRQSGVGS